MECLSRSLFSRSSISSHQGNDSNSAKNIEVIKIEDVEIHLQKWSVLNYETSLVYNKSSFVFKSYYIIKTVEEIFPFIGETINISLLSQSSINSYKENIIIYLKGMD